MFKTTLSILTVIACFTILHSGTRAREVYRVSPDLISTGSFLIQIDQTIQVDTSQTDSVIIDSLATDSGIDSVVYAKGKDSLLFKISEKKMEIYNEAYMKYKLTEVKGGKIFVDFDKTEMQAFPLQTDSTDTSKITQLPELIDMGEKYYGTRMRYNYKTRKGYITFARSESTDATYSGAKIKKMEDDSYFVESGVFTTCEADHPHYAFFCVQMKVIPDDKVIAKWIWLTFSSVPFPVPIPFGVFPLQKGRRSGILAPVFGNREGYGRYFSRFGYFWAINDYMDLTLTGDYYTRGGYGINSAFRYIKRYSFQGSLEAGFTRLIAGETEDPDRSVDDAWRLRWVHNHTLTPNSRFDANIDFQSANYSKQNSISYNDLLRTTIYSNLTYYQNWEEFGASLTANYSREQNLESGDISEVLPGVSFSKSIFYPFRKGIASNSDSWYDNLGITYSGQFQNIRKNVSDVLDVRGGVRHNISISASPKVGYISITPSFNYQELWYNKQINRFVEATPGSANFYNFGLFNTLNDVIVTNDVEELGFVRTFRAGISATTKIYGIFPINSFGIAAVRHTLIPRVGYDYQPDFADPKWGYYGVYTTSTGEEVKYNKFEREIFGGASRGEQQNINFSISNIFEMKTSVDPTDTTDLEKKIQLLNLNASLGYNIAADSLNFSNLFLDYRTQIGDIINLSGSSVFSLYDWDENGRDVNKMLGWDGGLLRLRNLNFSLSFTYSATQTSSEVDTSQTASSIFYGGASRYSGIYSDEDPDFTIPWSLSLAFNYSFSRQTPEISTKFTNIRADINFNLTKNWKFSVGGNYDLENKEFAAPQISISRDLHCWIMNFFWYPIGTYRGYRFEIKVKAPQLRDLKLEKSDNFFSGKR